MKLRIISVFLLLATALSFVSIVSAFDGVRKRLRFAKGKHSTTVAGAVIRGDQDIYTVGARGGQMITVKITSPENNAVFQVQDADGNFLQDAGEGDDARNWTGDLPQTGDYKIIVGGTRGNASYRLTVTIK